MLPPRCHPGEASPVLVGTNQPQHHHHHHHTEVPHPVLQYMFLNRIHVHKVTYCNKIQREKCTSWNMQLCAKPEVVLKPAYTPKYASHGIRLWTTCSELIDVVNQGMSYIGPGSLTVNT